MQHHPYVRQAKWYRIFLPLGVSWWIRFGWASWVECIAFFSAESPVKKTTHKQYIKILKGGHISVSPFTRIMGCYMSTWDLPWGSRHAANAKCRHPKKLTCKGTFRQVFIRVYRLEIQSVSHVGIFDPALWTVAPFTVSRVPPLTPQPALCE